MVWYWTECSSWRKHGYLLLALSHRYNNSKIVFTKKNFATKSMSPEHCQYFNWAWIWVTQRVSFVKQELPTLRDHSLSPQVCFVLLLFFFWCSSWWFFVFLLCPFWFALLVFSNIYSQITKLVLRFSQFSGCWLILSVYIFMSLDFPFVRLFGVR